MILQASQPAMITVGRQQLNKRGGENHILLSLSFKQQTVSVCVAKFKTVMFSLMLICSTWHFSLSLSTDLNFTLQQNVRSARAKEVFVGPETGAWLIERATSLVEFLSVYLKVGKSHWLVVTEGNAELYCASSFDDSS